jgi:hypothetical protein
MNKEVRKGDLFLIIAVTLILVILMLVCCTSRLTKPVTGGGLPDLSVLLPIAEDDSVFMSGYNQGKKEGGKILPFRSFRDGFAGGLIFSCLGGCIVAGAKYFAPEIPDTSIAGSMNFRAGYLQGYKEITRKRKGNWALTGAIIGTSCNIACVVFTVIWIKAQLD